MLVRTWKRDSAYDFNLNRRKTWHYTLVQTLTQNQQNQRLTPRRPQPTVEDGSQLHAKGILGFSGARQIVLRNRQHLRNMDL